VKHTNRLTRSNDFKRVRSAGRSYAHPLVVLVVAENGLEFSRSGVSAGQAVGNAIKRNRAKRQIRAVMKSVFPEIRAGWDIIVVARHAIPQACFYEIQYALCGLLRRAGLLMAECSR